MPHAHNGQVELSYEVHGSGDPILFIMGLGGTKEQWFPQLAHFPKTHTAIVYDNRGVGDSDVPDEAWTMADMAADAAAILDAEGIESAHVVGVSMGGMIAQHVALNHPERVRKLVLCATTPGTHHAPPSAEVLALMTQVKGKSREQIARDNLRLLFTDETIAAETSLMEKMVDLGIRFAPRMRGFRNQMNAIMGHNTRPRLGEFTHETLVITGDRDVLVPPQNSNILAEGIPGARLEVLGDTAHGFLLDRAEEANAIITEFLA